MLEVLVFNKCKTVVSVNEQISEVYLRPYQRSEMELFFFESSD